MIQLLSKSIISLVIYLFSGGIQSPNPKIELNKTIEEQINYYMKVGNIPGLSIAIVSGDSTQIIKGFGYADLEKKIKVTSESIFEIGSCSNAFTGLGILILEKEGKLKLDDPVSKFLPWFQVYYKKKKCEITIQQLLHHTSGIPMETISNIPQDSSEKALENTIKQIVGIELKSPPGTQFEYATINYDIIGLIIEKISSQSYKDYMHDVVFKTIGLQNTSVRPSQNGLSVAKGYKIGYFTPIEYDAPIFKGNSPAAYILSNADDMALWLKLQMGMVKSDLNSLVIKSQLRDESVAPARGNLSSYAIGWFISLNGDNKTFHLGLNPNFTAYVAFDKKTDFGVIVLANSNSSYTSVIGDYLFETFRGGVYKLEFNPDNGYDPPFSVLSIISGVFLLGIIFYIFYLIYIILKGTRKYSGLGIKKIGQLGLMFLLLIPILYAVYLIPKALMGFSWETILVWSPISFVVFIVILIALIGFSYIALVINALFPHPNVYWRSGPGLIILSIISGLANMVVILLIIGSVGKTEIKYNLFYFIFALIISLLGKKYVQTSMYKIAMTIVFDLRTKLANRVFSTSYQHFEKIDRGRIYSTLNDDASIIGNSANTVTNLITSIITVLGTFIYLGTLSFWALVIAIMALPTIIIAYNQTAKKAEKLFQNARDAQNVYLRLINGIIDGFKELSLQRNKKREYKGEIILASDLYRQSNVSANIKFINAFLVGEALHIIVLGFVAFGLLKLLPGIENYKVMTLIFILLYLIGPVYGIISSIPTLVQVKVALKRIHQFLDDIPANQDEINIVDEFCTIEKEIQNIVAKDIRFEYRNNEAITDFKVGPVSFELKTGEVMFIIGGNGSGKTTLAKLITGLYKPDNGKILINGNEIQQGTLGEYFSTVLNPFHLFDKMYNIDLKDKKDEINKFIQILGLDEKVKINGNKFSTIELSGGQRKRLALLQCYLEDRPIYLFDEWAADQDPEYRRFFYRELIPDMKRAGKIIIAITHDDHYFDVADKIIKLDMGEVEFISNSSSVENVLY